MSNPPPAADQEVSQTPRTLRGAIFDFGGVMTEPYLPHLDSGEVQAEDLELLEFFLKDFADVYHLPTGAHDLHLLEIGEISDEEFFLRTTRRFATISGHVVDPRRAQHLLFGRQMIACGAMVDAVRQLRGAGVRTALLTNISRDGEAIWSSLIPTDALFDTVVDSSQVGLRKPDPQIFRLVCSLLQLQPEECLFVDDLLCNVEAAKLLGMEVIQCHQPVEVADLVVRRFLGHSAADEAAVGPEHEQAMG